MLPSCIYNYRSHCVPPSGDPFCDGSDYDTDHHAWDSGYFDEVPFMEGWVPWFEDYPENGYRDPSDLKTAYRRQFNPTYKSLDDLALHQIPVHVASLTLDPLLQMGSKLNPYVSQRRGYEYGDLCWDASPRTVRYEEGSIA